MKTKDTTCEHLYQCSPQSIVYLHLKINGQSSFIGYLPTITVTTRRVRAYSYLAALRNSRDHKVGT